jgi:hypothetical protein
MASSYRSGVGLSVDMIHEMENIRRLKGWSKISPEFLKWWDPSSFLFAQDIVEDSNDLISKDEGVRRVGKIVGPNGKVSEVSTCEIKELFDTRLSFSFHFKHRDTIKCELLGKCGFVLECCPEKKAGQPYKFKVNLLLDQEKYPEQLHVHPELVKAEKIHLVPMIDIAGLSYGSERIQYRHALNVFSWNEYYMFTSGDLGFGKAMTVIIECSRFSKLSCSKYPSRPCH